MSSYPVVEISIEPIELCKLLKIANMVGGGGEAKIVISEGYVFVNNEVEYQKRKKIRHGDIVEFNGEVFEVAFSPKEKLIEEPKNNKENTKNPVKKKKTKKIKPNVEYIDETATSRTKRRSISF